MAVVARIEDSDLFDTWKVQINKYFDVIDQRITAANNLGDTGLDPATMRANLDIQTATKDTNDFASLTGGVTIQNLTTSDDFLVSGTSIQLLMKVQNAIGGGVINNLDISGGLTVKDYKSQNSGANGNNVEVNLATDTMTFDSLTISDLLDVTGTFTANGTFTSDNTEQLVINDNIILLDSDATTPGNDIGFEILRGDENTVVFMWSGDRFKLTENGTAYYDVIHGGNYGKYSDVGIEKRVVYHGKHATGIVNIDCTNGLNHHVIIDGNVTIGRPKNLPTSTDNISLEVAIMLIGAGKHAVTFDPIYNIDKNIEVLSDNVTVLRYYYNNYVSEYAPLAKQELDYLGFLEYNQNGFECQVDCNANGSVVALGYPWNHGTSIVPGYEWAPSGSLRIYDYVSGVYTQKGSVLEGDAVVGAGDLRLGAGNNVAISGDGLVVAMGVMTKPAGQYVYEWDATVNNWSIRESDMNKFGSAVALNSDGSKMVVCDTSADPVLIKTFSWDGTAYVLVNKTPTEPSKALSTIALDMSNDGKKLVLGKTGPKIYIYDWDGTTSTWVLGNKFDNINNDGLVAFTKHGNISISDDYSTVIVSNWSDNYSKGYNVYKYNKVTSQYEYSETIPLQGYDSHSQYLPGGRGPGWKAWSYRSGMAISGDGRIIHTSNGTHFYSIGDSTIASIPTNEKTISTVENDDSIPFVKLDSIAFQSIYTKDITSNPDTSFGCSAVLTNASSLYVGEPGHVNGTATGRLVVFYPKNAGGWEARMPLYLYPTTYAGGNAQDFGRALCATDRGIGTNNLFVGAPATNTATNTTGAVYVFRGSNEVATATSLNGVAVIDNPGTDTVPGFGSAVACSKDGRFLAIGNPNTTETGVASTGRVYIYEQTSQDVFVLRDEFTASSAVGFVGLAFGQAIDISDDGNRVVVGAIGNKSTPPHTPALYTYHWDGTKYTEANRMEAPYSLHGDATIDSKWACSGLAFGEDKDTLYVGDKYFTAGKSITTAYGAVFRLEWSGKSSTWTNTGMVLDGRKFADYADGAEHTRFPVSMTYNFNRLIIGNEMLATSPNNNDPKVSYLYKTGKI